MIAKKEDVLGKDGGIVRLAGEKGFFWLGGQESPLWGDTILL